MSEPMTYSMFFDAARDGLKLGPDRHPKWQRVEPGTVIPAGQPYRVENEGGYHSEYPGRPFADVYYDRDEIMTGLFIDSSWKPPLVLPTEPCVIRAVVNGRPDVLLTGPHPADTERGSGPVTWEEFDNHFHYPDEISSFEVLWTEDE